MSSSLSAVRLSARYRFSSADDSSPVSSFSCCSFCSSGMLQNTWQSQRQWQSAACTEAPEADTHLSMFLIWLWRARNDTGESMASRLLAQRRTTFRPVWWIFSVSWSTAMLLGAQTSTGLGERSGTSALPREAQQGPSAELHSSDASMHSHAKAEQAKVPTPTQAPAPSPACEAGLWAVGHTGHLYTAIHTHTAMAVEHLPVALPSKVVDNSGRRHRLACAWRALDEAEWSLQHGLHSIYLQGGCVSKAVITTAPQTGPAPRVPAAPESG